LLVKERNKENVLGAGKPNFLRKSVFLKPLKASPFHPFFGTDFNVMTIIGKNYLINKKY
jgi:hypothetical protein